MAEDGKVDVTYGADTEGIERGSARAAAAIKDFTSKIEGYAEKIGDVFGTAVAAIGSAEVLDKIKEFNAAMGELGEQVERTSAMMGLSTEEVTKLQYVAASTGQSLSSMALGLERFGSNAAKAQAGNKLEQDAFQRLGITVTDTSGRMKSYHELLLETADAFASHANGAEKANLALQLFNRAGIQMIPALNKGREGILELEKQAEETGSVLSEDTVAGMTKTQQSLTELGASFRGLGVALFNAFGPGLRGLTAQIINLVQNFTHWTNESYRTNGAMRVLAFGFDVVVAGIDTLIEAFEILWDVASGILNALGDGLFDFGNAMAFAISGNWQLAWQYAKKMAADMAPDVQSTTDAVLKSLNTYKDTMKEMFGETVAGMNNITVGGEGGGGAGRKPQFSPPTDLSAANKALDAYKAKIKEVQSTFKGLFDSIISGMDKAVTGLVTGTMSWQEAMFSVLDGIWSSIVKFVEDWVAKWLAGEATILVAHVTGNNVKVASDEVARDASSANMIFDAIKAIFVSSKQTAAGVTANLAPTMGPFAIPAGLAAGASVAALASLDVGSWNVPSDMVANIHAGEAILPAGGGIADSFRDMMKGGGPGGGAGETHNHFHGAVMDWKSIVRGLNQYYAMNPSSRGAH